MTGHATSRPACSAPSLSSRSRPDRRTRTGDDDRHPLAPSRVLALALALTAGGVLWMQAVHAGSGLVEHDEPGLLVHWLRDGALALVPVLAATLLGLVLAARLLRTDGTHAALARATVVACVGTAAAAALALGVPVHERLFVAHEAHDVPLTVHVLRDGMVALAAMLPLTALLRPWTVWHARRPAPPSRPRLRTAVASLGAVSLVAAGAVPLSVATATPAAAAIAPQCASTVTAHVVALDQALTFNRLGAQNPQGMVFALRRDVRPEQGATGLQPGEVTLREGKRPRPLTLRVNVGDCLQIEFENLLDPTAVDDQPATREAGVHVNGLQLVHSIDDSGTFVGKNSDGLVRPGGVRTYTYYAEKEGTYLLSSTADNVSGEALTGTLAFGLFGAVNVEPRGSEWYRSQLTRAELDLAAAAWTFDAAAGTWTPSKEAQAERFVDWDGDETWDAAVDEPFTDVDGSGALEDGEPFTDWNGNGVRDTRLAEPFTDENRNQTRDAVRVRLSGTGQPVLNYAAVYPSEDRPGHDRASSGLPILRLVDDAGEIVHSDLNAIITGPDRGAFPAGTYRPNPTYPERNQPFREFTVVFHDEIKAVQAFDIFRDPKFAHTLHGVKDGFAINYGVAGAGAEIVANRLGVGPMAECQDCKFEEFFLTSWAVGDPAMVVDVPANADLTQAHKATTARYPADPANVFHSYLNDHVKIRNLHVGKEHHIFHLHAHQWLATPDDDGSSYLDSQAIGPGTGYTYEIAYNGSGNRNKTPGDSIFHCHFYPHFAQGMWALWRVHDTFEKGTALDAEGRPLPGERALPDAEIKAGTPVPGVVPLPTLGMAPMPAPGVSIDQETGQVQRLGELTGNPGYPYWIPARAGHRPPTPPRDLLHDGGLPRHVITGGTTATVTTPYDMSKELTTASADFLPEEGTAEETAAMEFHADRFHATTKPDGSTPAEFETNGRPAAPGAPYADPCRNDDGTPRAVNRTYKGANIQLDMTLNKAGWHFPQSRLISLWRDVDATLKGTRPPEPFVMRANSGDCVEYQHTSLVPEVYEQDAFQIRTPTDVVGQHIHLVKFDVTAADGSANGFNYEDGTFSPGEVQERIRALKAGGGSCSGAVTDCSELEAKPHPFFGAGPGGRWLGARTTVQRWWVDPVLDDAGKDRGLGNVYTHDHYGPSTHQQVGLYGTLLTEPAGSTWRHPESGATFGTRNDGGPTSWRADILTKPAADSHREYYFEFQDFQLAYEAGRGVDGDGKPVPDPMGAINPPSKKEVDGPELFRKLRPDENCPGGSPNTVRDPETGRDRGCPEAISAADVGTFTVNYRNEPLALRLRDPATNRQAAGQAGDPALAFSSRVRRADSRLNAVGPYPPLTGGVQALDPFTPLMRSYDNDKVNIRIQVGATEEGHNATMHGVKWLQEPGSRSSGWRNGQMLGISEQFRFETPIAPRLAGATRNTTDYLYAWSASVDGLWNGTWGAMRAYRTPQADLRQLPNNPVTAQGVAVSNLSDFNRTCPKTAPVRRLSTTAVLARDVLPAGTLTYNSRPDDPLHDPTAIMYVRTADLDPVTGKLKAGVPVEPLVLRAAAGECVELTVANRLPASAPDLPGFSALPPIVDGFNANAVRPSSMVGLRPQLLSYTTSADEGAAVGLNNVSQLVAPGTSKKLQWYAGDVTLKGGRAVATPVEFGATNLISADPIKHTNKGAIGALVVEPAGSSWVEDADRRASATVTAPGSATPFREHVLVFQDDVNLRRGTGAGTAVPFVAGNEDVEDSGGAALNYRTEPLWHRLGIAPETSPTQLRTLQLADVLSNGKVRGANGKVRGDPETPVFTSKAGQPTRLRVLQPGGHARNHVVSVAGHSWQRSPYVPGDVASARIGVNPLSVHRGAQEGIGPADHFDLVLDHGAGGLHQVTGDHLIRDMTPIRFYNGTWAVLRVE